MKITLEGQVEFEKVIKQNGNWAEYKKCIAELNRKYRSATLSEEQYLNAHGRTTLYFAMGI